MKIIGLTGTNGAGKSTVVDYLVKQRNFEYFSVRDYLTKVLNIQEKEANRDNMRELANTLRKENGGDFIVRELYKNALSIGKDCIIESIRCKGEVESLYKMDDFILLAVCADEKVRFDRILKRSSSTDKIDYETFIKQEKSEMNNSDPFMQNLEFCINNSNFIIDNNYGFDELYAQIDSILKDIDNLSNIDKGGKRCDYISWDEYFMGLALFSAKRSKDPSTQVGACIVNEENKVVGLGYNGFPKGCDDSKLPWGRDGSFLNTKYPYVVHAEANAILNAIHPLTNCKLYVSLFPCNNCAKQIIQSGIKEVIYLEDKYHDLEESIASRILLNTAKIRIRKFYPKNKSLSISFE